MGEGDEGGEEHRSDSGSRVSAIENELLGCECRGRWECQGNEAWKKQMHHSGQVQLQI